LIQAWLKHTEKQCFFEFPRHSDRQRQMQSGKCDEGAMEKLSEGIKSILDKLDVTKDGECVQIQPARRDDLNSYSMFEKFPLEQKKEFVELAALDGGMNRAMGSMCGMAIGDALGHPFEFMPAQDVPKDSYFDLKSMAFIQESNTFGLKRGQWTDDASMGLCMADSLILKKCFDGGDMRVRFWCWWNRGYNNAFRKDPTRSSSCGLGGNISCSLSALSRLTKGDKVPPAYKAQTEDAGNGSLMRFAPVAIFCHSAPPADVYDIARKSSYTTHPGIIAAEACSLLSHLIVRALQLPDKAPIDAKQFLDEATEEYYEKSGLSKKSGWGYDQMRWLVTSKPEHDTELCWNWKAKTMKIRHTLKARGGSYNGYPVSSGYFGSYSLDGLALALWSVYNTESFDEAVTRSVNLLGDADSHGSITGQLAGALYGYRSINPQFLKWMNRWDDHEFALRGILLYYLGMSPHCNEKIMGLPPTVTEDPDMDKQPLISRVSTTG